MNTQEEMKLETLIQITKSSSSNVGWQLANGNDNSKGLSAKLHPVPQYLKTKLFQRPQASHAFTRLSNLN